MSKKFSVEGKSIDDLLRSGRNVGRMTEGTLRQIVTRLASAANKRLRRAEQANLDSPAVKEAIESGGRFTSRGKGLEGLKAEFIRLKAFLQDKTSTIKGWQAEQKQAMAESRRRGIFNDSDKPTAKPPVINNGKSTSFASHPDIDTSEDDPATTQETEDTTGTWRYEGTGWTYNEEKKYWEHPDFGSGWLPNEEEGVGGFIDPASGDIVGATQRQYHNYDAYEDNRRYDKWTETAYIWRMVDDLVKMDPRFTRTYDSDPKNNARNRLFDAIDNIWVENPGISFEDARDRVAQQLDNIYQSHLEFIDEARKLSMSKYFEGNLNEDSDW